MDRVIILSIEGIGLISWGEGRVELKGKALCLLVCL